MNFLRSLLRFLLLPAALCFVAALILLTPSAQSWLAKRALNRRPGVHASLGSFWIGFGKVQVEQARLERDGFVLTLPQLDAALPATPALLGRRLALRSLSAKGWTLDLTRTPSPQAPAVSGAAADAAVPEPATPASSAATGAPNAAAASGAAKAPPLATLLVAAVRDLFAGWPLPLDFSADRVELEGDVLVIPAPGAQAVPVHTKIHGGGLAVGETGTFEFEAEAAFLDSDNVPVFYSIRGRIRASMTSPRSLAAASLGVEVSARGGSLTAEAVEVSVNLSRLPAAATTGTAPETKISGRSAEGRPGAAASAGVERYACDVMRDGRRLLQATLGFFPGTERLGGAWKLDLRQSDAAALGPVLPFSGGAVAGEGTVEADSGLERLQVGGHLRASGNGLTLLSVPLERLGARSLEMAFDVTQHRPVLEVKRLEISLAGERPVARARSLQAFSVDEKTGAVTPAEPKADWLEATVTALPLRVMEGLCGPLHLAGADTAGELLVRADGSRFDLRSRAPLAAEGVSAFWGQRLLVRGVSLSLAVSGEIGANGWKLRASPLRLRRGGTELASAELTVGREARKGAALTLEGTWTADLSAANADLGSPALGALQVNRGSGDLSLVFGETLQARGKAVLTGGETERRLELGYETQSYPGGAVVFHLPLSIAWGRQHSDIAFDGTWTSPDSGYPMNLRFSAKEADLEHLRWLASPLGLLFAPGAVEAKAAGTRDEAPFWGVRQGQVMIALDQLQAGGDLLKDVRGTVLLDPRGLQLKYGGYIAPDGNLTPVDGALTFDPAAPTDPYQLKLTFDPVTIDAAPYFGETPEGQDPPFHGKFSVASTVVGRGRNLAELVGRAEQEFRLSSKNGIVRLLKTHITLAGPEPSKPLVDTAGRVGSAIGSFFGAKGLRDSGAVKVNPTTQAVFDLSYGVAEIGYKELTLTARRGADGTVRIADLVMEADHERLTGSGRMTAVPGKSLRAWPLSVELKLAAHDDIATLLGRTGLPVGPKDKDGFVPLEQPFHFAGTLDHLDTSEWHDLLLEAAKKPMEEKK